jgi:hypothetical protein
MVMRMNGRQMAMRRLGSKSVTVVETEQRHGSVACKYCDYNWRGVVWVAVQMEECKRVWL